MSLAFPQAKLCCCTQIDVRVDLINSVDRSRFVSTINVVGINSGGAVLLHLWIRQKEANGSVAQVGFGFVELLSEVLI